MRSLVMGDAAVDLGAILRRRAVAPAGTTVRRSGFVAPLVLLVALVGATLWLFGALMEGRLDTGQGKSALALVAAPFLVLWWCWQSLRAVVWRARGRFAWALSDAELLFVDPWGQQVGPLPLAAITALTYDLDPSGRPGFVATIEYGAHPGGRSGGERVSFPSLEGLDLLQSFTRPSDGRAFFEAVCERLMRVNPSARIYPALSQPQRPQNGFR